MEAAKEVSRVKVYRNTTWTHLTLLALCAALVSSAFTGHAQQRGASPLQQQDRQAIEDLHQREIEANIALDVVALASLWSDDIVSLPPDGPPLVGREANLHFLEATAKQMADYNILSYAQEWQQVYQTDPEYAFEWGTISGRLQPPANAREIEYRYKVLRILKRQPNGTWRVHRTSWSDAMPKAALTAPAPAPAEPSPEQ
ncbi:MAG: DUF4440 domain-containing protein [Candidatus Korobacteraceae bacterium]